MPQLTSGRHYCVGLDPLHQLVEGVKDNPFITDLLAIERTEDLYPYIELMYLREDASIATPSYAPGSLPVSADLKSFPCSYTVDTMKPEIES